MKANHKTHGKKIFFEIAVVLILLMAIFLPIGTTLGKYSQEFSQTLTPDFEINWNSPDHDPANPDGPGIEEQAPTTVYQVQPGDTLSALAEKFHTTVEDLAACNGLDPAAPLTPGTTLKIPSPASS